MLLSSFTRSILLKPNHIYMINSSRNCRKFSTTYNNLITKRPFLMQAIQTGILMGTGDLIAQTLIEQTPLKNIDFMRTFKFVSIGCLAGPGLRVWYGVLAKNIRASSPLLLSIKKVAIDQICFAPIFIAVFLSVLAFLQHPSIDNVKQKLNREYTDILLTNYMIWPGVQFLNFRYIPLNYQVLLAQTIAVAWNVYISWKTNVNERKKKQLLKPDDKI